MNQEELKEYFKAYLNEMDEEDTFNTYKEHIADLVESGYKGGYEPNWDIEIEVDNGDYQFLSSYLKEIIAENIAYPIRDGYQSYHDVEIWVKSRESKEEENSIDLAIEDDLKDLNLNIDDFYNDPDGVALYVTYYVNVEPEEEDIDESVNIHEGKYKNFQISVDDYDGNVMTITANDGYFSVAEVSDCENKTAEELKVLADETLVNLGLIKDKYFTAETDEEANANISESVEDKTVRFMNKTIHYGNVHWLDEDVFVVDFGDGELTDNEGDKYFIHVEHYPKDADFVIEVWYEDHNMPIDESPIKDEISKADIEALKAVVYDELKLNENIKESFLTTPKEFQRGEFISIVHAGNGPEIIKLIDRQYSKYEAAKTREEKDEVAKTVEQMLDILCDSGTAELKEDEFNKLYDRLHVLEERIKKDFKTEWNKEEKKQRKRFSWFAKNESVLDNALTYEEVCALSDKFDCRDKSPRQAANLCIKFIKTAMKDDKHDKSDYFNTRVWDGFAENGEEISKACCDAIVREANKSSQFKYYVTQVFKRYMPVEKVLNRLNESINEVSAETMKSSLKKQAKKGTELYLKFDDSWSEWYDKFRVNRSRYKKIWQDVLNTKTDSEKEKFMKEYRRNEDGNYHFENLLLTAEFVEDKELIKTAKSLLNKYRKQGGYNSGDEIGKAKMELGYVLDPIFDAVYDDLHKNESINEVSDELVNKVTAQRKLNVQRARDAYRKKDDEVTAEKVAVYSKYTDKEIMQNKAADEINAIDDKNVPIIKKLMKDVSDAEEKLARNQELVAIRNASKTESIEKEEKREVLPITFVRVDDWNRPIFKAKSSSGKTIYLSDVNNLFDYATDEKAIKEFYKDKEPLKNYITFHGYSVDSEPMGNQLKYDLEIV